MTTDTTHITKEGLLQAIEEQRGLALLDGYKPTQLDNILARAAELSAQTPEGFCPKCNTRIGVHGGCDCGFCSPKLSAQESKPVAFNIELAQEAFEEAFRRYQGNDAAERALLWVHGASGIGVGKPSAADIEWAKGKAALSVSAQDASPKDGWQPIETAPKTCHGIGLKPYNPFVLLTDGAAVAIGYRNWHKTEDVIHAKEWPWDICRVHFIPPVESWGEFIPTHWQPLPEPPK